MYFNFSVNLFYSISDTTDFLSLNVGIFLYATRIICTVLPWLNFFIAFSCLSVSTFKCFCNEFNLHHWFFLGCCFPHFDHAFGPTNQCKVAQLLLHIFLYGRISRIVCHFHACQTLLVAAIFSSTMDASIYNTTKICFLCALGIL